ncbi:uncharacterized protein LOC117136412 isoform X2 [Drosophila mauritiana]|uniref:Uncharacterized protein LOC117136412 isoform X2 n=1 Tax=Drosophila mauritiana TaxID=7226 RepID=A0A6P8JBB5_DROMA|nr:uncharacterized protein LOC117136412 isoform X2 [Drosophila mauritiana]
MAANTANSFFPSVTLSGTRTLIHSHNFRAPNGASLCGRTSTQMQIRIEILTVLVVVLLHQWRELPTDRVLVLVCWCIKADAAAAVDVAARSDSVLLEYSALSLSGTPVPVAEWPSGSLAAEPCLALFFGVFCVLLCFFVRTINTPSAT